MSIIAIEQDNFQKEVLEADKPVLLDFWASWCGPCKMLSPLVDELAEAHPEIKVGKVNVDEQPDLAMRYKVMSIPTLILFRDGQPAATAVGYRPMDELEQILQ